MYHCRTFTMRHAGPLPEINMTQYKVTNVHQLYVIRFFVGAAGSLFFPAVQWYLGCWYKRSELSRRGALFFIASQIGGMSSGYIQSGAHATLNGKHGIEGWRWLYIICKYTTITVDGVPAVDNTKASAAPSQSHYSGSSPCPASQTTASLASSRPERSSWRRLAWQRSTGSHGSR